MPAYDASLFTPPAPLARVKLRRSGSTVSADDVPMLIDSGADITLVPKTSINQLGINASPGSGYELMVPAARSAVDR